MITSDPDHEAFTTQSSDPAAWRELAQILTIAAAPVRRRLFEVAHTPQAIEENRLEKLAYVKAYMLLMGLAFENLLKAVALSRDQSLEPLMKKRGGHGLLAIADLLTLQLAQDERDYLGRLEEYVVWAGRYPVSRAAADYVRSQRQRLLTFRSEDPSLGDRLFAKIVTAIRAERLS